MTMAAIDPYGTSDSQPLAARISRQYYHSLLHLYRLRNIPKLQQIPPAAPALH
jgi:hypothetical protein